MLQNVIIADDSIPMHRLIRTQLAMDGFVFHSAYDGASAVAMAGSVQPDLILLDIDMPEMNGLEACMALKADPFTASIPVLFLSADSISTDKEKALELGALDFIKKPFSPDHLRATVRSSLEATPISTDRKQIDPLTGLWNKDCFDLQLREQYILAKLTGQPLSCLVYELDQIGSIHTRFGTARANQVIRKASRILFEPASHGQSGYALPSGRFAALVRDQDRFEAAKKATRIQSTLARTLSLEAGADVAVSCSVGISDSLISSAADLFERAVGLLHRAMDRGGNCVSIARDRKLRSKPVLAN